MKKPTFQEQFNKITEAYIQGTLDPFKNCACFIGNLLNGDPMWANGRSITIKEGNIRWLLLDHGTNFLSNRRHIVVAQANPLLAKVCVKVQSSGMYHMDDIMNMECNFLNVYVKGGGR